MNIIVDIYDRACLTCLRSLFASLVIHSSIADITHRLQDLQNDLVEPNMNAPTVFVFLCTETLLSVSYESFDDFVI